MRRKQLYAIMLAGALTVSGTPAAVFAAEEGVSVTAETAEPAAEEGQNEESPAETPANTEENTASAEETPAQETPTENTPVPEVPAQETPAAETPAQEETTADPSAVPEETSPTPTAAEEAPSQDLAEGESAEPTAISVAMTDGEGAETMRYFTSLQAAVNAVGTSDMSVVPVIRISEDLALNEAVEITAGNRVCITAVGSVNLTRAEGYTGSMFKVSGKNEADGTASELQLKSEGEGAGLTLNGAGAEGNTLIAVSGGASFGMFAGVTLTGNKTADNGGAITNNGGRILLAGGTVTDNIGAYGAVYSDTAVCVQGDINISGNKAVSTEGAEITANLYVALSEGTEGAAVKLTDALGENAAVGYTDAAPADNKVIIEAGTKSDGTTLSKEEFDSAITKFTYDDAEKFTVGAAESAETLQAVLKAAKGAEEPTVTPGVTVTPTVSPKPTEAPAESTFKITQSGQLETKNWTGYSKVKISFTVSEACEYYVKYTDINSTLKNEYNPGSVTVRKANAGKVSFTIGNVSSSRTAIAIYAKSESGAVQTCKIELKNRPAFDILQDGSDSWSSYNKLKTVKFKATHDCTYYWQVIGAKESTDDLKFDDKKAVNSAKVNESVSIKNIEVPDGEYALAILAKSAGNGDVKRIKITFKNRPEKASREIYTYSVTDNKVSGLESPLQFFPSQEYTFTVTEAGMDNLKPVAGDEKYEFLYWSMSASGSNPNTKTRILSQKGIAEANTYSMYLFFQKYTYNGKEWEKEGSPEYLKTQFYSAGYTEDELKDYLIQAKEEGNDIPGYEDYVPEADLTEAASEKDAGVTAKSAVSTADESPIGTMSALAMLSLLAGGYVLVRKRKKEEI